MPLRRLHQGSGTGWRARRALGINPDATTVQINSDLDHLVAVGVQTLWLVLDCSWLFPSSTTPDATIAGHYDDCVNGAVSRGMTVALQIQGNPAWNITAGGHTGTAWHGPDNATERGNYTTMVHNAVDRWETNITWAQVWNEPNLVEFWEQGPSPDNYTRLLRDIYVDLHGSWPWIRVVGHNMARSDFGWLAACYTSADTIFTAAVAAASRYYFDVLGLHPYCGTSTSGYDPADTSHADETGTAGGVLGPDYLDFARFAAQIQAKEGSVKPAAFGETGYATLGTGWYQTSEANRQVWVPRMVKLARDSLDIPVEFIAIFYHRVETPTDYFTSFNIHGSATETAFATA